MNVPNDSGIAAGGLRHDRQRCLNFGHLLLMLAWLVAGCGAPLQEQHQHVDVPKTGTGGAEPNEDEKKADEPKREPGTGTKDVNGQLPPLFGLDEGTTSTVILSDDGDRHGREKSLGEPSKKSEPAKEKGGPTKVENERIRATDEALRSLETANIAFNAPESLNIDDTARIQLLLSLEKSVAELKSQIEAAGKLEGTSVRVSDRMKAELKGPDFEITVITPEEQAIATAGDTEWRWDVKPKSSGRLQLNLTLTAILSIQGRDTQRMIKTLDKFIEIEVTPAQKIVGFFEKAWQWIWAAILVPIVGWLWSKWKSKPDSPKSPT